MPNAKQSKNKTGVDQCPAELAKMLAGVAEFPPTSTGTKFADDAVRIAYARSVDPSDRNYGSVPDRDLDELSVWIDKLGERLAFERTGVRMYEMLISKHVAFGGFKGGPSRADLVLLLNEEHCHHSLLRHAMLRIGADPTAVTPSADMVGVLGKGIVQVLADPRTNLKMCLEVILVAEIADGVGWQALIELARKAGHEELVESFMEAERTEQEHRNKVERWVAAALGL